MSDPAALVALLQLMDSTFPIGTFAHSYGLEQLVRDRHVRDAGDVEAFVTSVVVSQMARADALAAAGAAETAARGDLDAVCEVDRALYRTKAAVELRDASTSTGARLLQELTAHPEARHGLVEAYAAAVSLGESPGTHPVAAGVAAAAFEVAPGDLVAGLLFSTANALTQAAMRLLPVSHRDAQAMLHRVRSEIASIATASEATRAGATLFASFHPLQEIAAMRHPSASVRFFAS